MLESTRSVSAGIVHCALAVVAVVVVDVRMVVDGRVEVWRVSELVLEGSGPVPVVLVTVEERVEEVTPPLLTVVVAVAGVETLTLELDLLTVAVVVEGVATLVLVLVLAVVLDERPEETGAFDVSTLEVEDEVLTVTVAVEVVASDVLVLAVVASEEPSELVDDVPGLVFERVLVLEDDGVTTLEVEDEVLAVTVTVEGVGGEDASTLEVEDEVLTVTVAVEGVATDVLVPVVVLSEEPKELEVDGVGALLMELEVVTVVVVVSGDETLEPGVKIVAVEDVAARVLVLVVVLSEEPRELEVDGVALLKLEMLKLERLKEFEVVTVVVVVSGDETLETGVETEELLVELDVLAVVSEEEGTGDTPLWLELEALAVELEVLMVAELLSTLR